MYRTRFMFSELFILLLSLIHSGPLRAEMAVPAFSSPVVDQAGVLGAATQQLLNSELRRLRDTGGSQIAVLIVPELQQETIEAYSIRVTDQWKLGDRDKDNGVLLLLAIKERNMRIEVGQGLEGVLPDAYAKRIIQQDIQPRLSSGDFDAGILAGIARIASYTDSKFVFSGDGRFQLSAVGDALTGMKSLLPIPLLIILGIILLLSFLRRLGGRRGRPGQRDGWGTANVLAAVLAGSMGGRSRGGGGFGGGGGGGFSGGGASGRW